MAGKAPRRVRWIGPPAGPELRGALTRAGLALDADPDADPELLVVNLSGSREALAADLAPWLEARSGRSPGDGDRAAPEARDPVPDLVGVSTCIVNVKELVRAAARTESPAFITGPSGTGKELVARSIHRLSPRVKGPFVPVNCGALPESLAEAELFGAEKGAFTGALTERVGLVQAAAGGTLFLDEIGEMPVELQVKLLRVLQEKAVRRVGGLREIPVDVRILAATNRDPLEAVRAGTLREDLYYRLAVLRIRLDPLGARPEDVGPLVRSFLDRLSERYGSGPTQIAEPALERLRSYPWPGNVRELWNVLDLIFALGRARDRIEVEHLPEEIRNHVRSEPADSEPSRDEPGGDPAMRAGPTLRDAELALIRRALARSGGNKAKAARTLGISRPALYRRLEELGLA